jgi:hypothetical protein
MADALRLHAAAGRVGQGYNAVDIRKAGQRVRRFKGVGNAPRDRRRTVYCREYTDVIARSRAAISPAIAFEHTGYGRVLGRASGSLLSLRNRCSRFSGVRGADVMVVNVLASDDGASGYSDYVTELTNGSARLDAGNRNLVTAFDIAAGLQLAPEGSICWHSLGSNDYVVSGMQL